MIFTWSFWAFHDIPGNGKYGFSRSESLLLQEISKKQRDSLKRIGKCKRNADIANFFNWKLVKHGDIKHLFHGRIISWINLKDRYELTYNIFFQWAQLKHAIRPRWKIIIFDYSDINLNDLFQNHHVIKGARILPLGKLSSEEIYSILISNIVNKPT